ncbi:hypothetical protein JTE90_028690 [Oedothorax gibbosus]|uniref:MATH domain-containing protein n=1 Tax=Oedothorax gibbosus TaxID=931172 RepID=A0AAV6TZ21_9ARAC|nr:hypothetical protein JTE90_028690 [Oedothorax gibbosus]
MSDKCEDVVTLLWDIENINKLFTYKIESPVFLSHSLDRTRWKMCLYPKGRDNNSDHMSFSIIRCGSWISEVNRIILDGELSIMDELGEPSLVSKHIKNHGFIKDHSWSTCKTFVSSDDVFNKRRTDFIPYNVLHVRCRLWKSFNNTTLSELITSHTKIERSYFIWKIENFSCLKDHEVKKMHVKTPFSGSPTLSYRFYTDEIYDEAIIEIKPNNGFNLSIWCEVMALNSTGERFDWKYNAFTLNDECIYERCLTLNLSRLLNNKTLYLPMDALSLRIDSFYWSSDVNVSPITIPNMQICENIPSTEKSDCQGEAENVMSSPRKYDQQSMTKTDNTEVYHFKPDKSCEKEKCDVNPDTHQNLERFVQDMHCMEGVVTLLWDIENFNNNLLEHKIESTVFLSNSLDQTRWKMCLYTTESNDGITLNLTRCGSLKQRVHELVLDCELSILDENGSITFVSKQITKHGFVENHTWSPCEAFVSRSEVFSKRRADFIPDNVLHIRCQIWRSFNNTTLSELITSQTKIERSYFIWKIENFSCLKDREMKKIHVKTLFSGSPTLSYRFYTDEIYDEAIIEIKPNNGFNLSIWCEVMALNSTGEMFDWEHNAFTLNEECIYKRCLTLNLSRLLNNKTLYLPMDALSLRIDSFYWSSDVNVSPITIPNMQICENIPSTEKSDCQGKAENVMSSPRKCDQQSMTENENTKVCAAL